MTKRNPAYLLIGAPPEGWRSGSDLMQDYIGGNVILREKILGLAIKKKADYLAAGKSEAEADKLIQDHWVRRCYGAGTHGVITEFISPEGLQELIKAGELITPEQAKLLAPPEGWRSGNDLKWDYVGGNVTLREKILALAAKKKAAYLAAGKSEEEANQLIQDHWVRRCYCHGTSGTITEFISPEGLQELIKAGELITPEQARLLVPPEGWRSGSDLTRDYIGSSVTLREKILALAIKKKAAYLAAGKSEEEADQLIQQYWVRRCYGSGTRGIITEFISPEGLQELLKTGEFITPEQAKLLAPPQGWRSGKDLTRDYIGDNITLRKKILALAAKKKTAYLAAGKSETEADQLIQDHWVRRCYGAGTHGTITEFISPTGIAELIDQSILEPRHKPAPHNIASLLASGMSDDEVKVTLNLSKAAFASAREAIAKALAENGGADLALYKAELAHNRKISREDFMAAVQSHGSIEDAAQSLGLSPQRVMARLGRYWKLDVALLDKLDQPTIHMDMALRVDFTQLPRTSPAATWFAVKQLHSELGQAPDLNQIAEKLKIKRGLVDRNVHFLIACDSLRREDLAQPQAAMLSASAIGFAIRQHWRGCLFR
ncbi:MAG: hypothetical protein AB7G80_03645 [Dongiaceae bacterium]